MASKKQHLNNIAIRILSVVFGFFQSIIDPLASSILTNRLVLLDMIILEDLHWQSTFVGGNRLIDHQFQPYKHQFPHRHKPHSRDFH